MSKNHLSEKDSRLDLELPERFAIQRKLGSNRKAGVFLAHDKDLGIDIAVKKILPTLQADDQDTLERFKRECALLSSLNYPQLVKSYGFFESTEGEPFLVMEYVEGVLLSDVIEQGSLSLEEKISILIQLGNAVAHIHAAGIVHRDIRPSNVLIQEGNAVKLLDLGLARRVDVASNLTRVGEVVGNLGYASPEQRLTGATVAARSDIYSYGITAFELLTGREPFRGQYIEHVIVGHLYLEAPDLRVLCPTLPRWLAELVAICIEKKPEYRYGSMSEVVERLECGLQRLKNGSPLRYGVRSLRSACSLYATTATTPCF